MRRCTICGKVPVRGRTITKRGMPKKQGGVGRKIVRTNLRRFLPNLQRTRVRLDGAVRRVAVCTACLRTGRVPKAPVRCVPQAA